MQTAAPAWTPVAVPVPRTMTWRPVSLSAREIRDGGAFFGESDACAERVERRAHLCRSRRPVARRGRSRSPGCPAAACASTGQWRKARRMGSDRLEHIADVLNARLAGHRHCELCLELCHGRRRLLVVVQGGERELCVSTRQIDGRPRDQPRRRAPPPSPKLVSTRTRLPLPFSTATTCHDLTTTRANFLDRYALVDDLGNLLGKEKGGSLDSEEEYLNSLPCTCSPWQSIPT